jgi:MoaA/NifB/PqqE/SkfB family radical SAM enzyme
MNLTKIIPNVPKRLEGKFPQGYKDTFPYWGFFSREKLEKSKGKLLMLDLDFGRFCSLHCPTCFRRESLVDDIEEGDLTYDELIRIIDDARGLGLESVKICGVGEPTENSRFLEFIRDMTSRDVGVAVFTKGQVLGSDERASQFNRKYGINSAHELCEVLYRLKVSFMLGFQSFDTDIQDQMFGKEGHTLVRNRALENLVNAGFNSTSPTRLAFCNAPFTRETYNEAFGVYVYARERNIYPVTAVLMTSGKQIDCTFLQKHDLTAKEKIDLWVRIYSWNIEHGLQNLKQIREDGVSCLPGGHPCNQLARGLYITAKGNVVGCPGFVDIQGNVRDQSIGEIWKNSTTRKIASERFNCGCPPKEGITIPFDLYREVLLCLEKKYGETR